jgi:LemA protein
LRNRAQSVPEGDVAARAAVEAALSQALGRVFALAEAYPDLKANENFGELQRSLETIEGELQMSRRYYNGAARDLNVRVESFPSNLIANAFRFARASYFEITNEADRAVPSVKF